MRYIFIFAGMLAPLLFWGQANSPATQQNKIQPVKFRLNSEKTRVDKDLQLKKDVPAQSIAEDEMNDQEMITSGLEKKASYSKAAEDYWFNAYQVKRNAELSDDGMLDVTEQRALKTLVESSKSEIAGSFTWNYLQLRENRNSTKAMSFFTQASQLQPTSSLLPAEAAWLAERAGDLSLRNKALESCKANSTITAFQSTYSRWMLDAVPEGALIVTNGEFDTYPIWEQQGKKNVWIVSLAMLQDATWLKKTLLSWDPSLRYTGNSETDFFNTISASQKAIYFSWTLRSDILNTYRSHLFPVGPLCRFSQDYILNVSELQRFYTSKPVVNVLQSSGWKNDRYAQLARNLIPGLIMLQQNPDLNSTEKQQLVTLQQIIENTLPKTSGR